MPEFDMEVLLDWAQIMISNNIQHIGCSVKEGRVELVFTGPEEITKYNIELSCETMARKKTGVPDTGE